MASKELHALWDNEYSQCLLIDMNGQVAGMPDHRTAFALSGLTAFPLDYLSTGDCRLATQEQIDEVKECGALQHVDFDALAIKHIEGLEEQ